MTAHVCPICGFSALVQAPRTSSGGGSYEICPSCGFQFGVTDDDRGYTYEQWRAEWRKRGMPWDNRSSSPPPDWDPVEQLRRVGVEFK
jgi:hypothetical protein